MLLDLTTFAVIGIVLFSYFLPHYLLSVTTTTGGDTGAHVYAAWYLRNELLPKGMIAGWSPGWYAGFPIFQFYFPLVATIQALLSYVIPFEVAFKLGSVLGTLFLPIAVYILFRLLRFRWPTPALGALAGVGFLMMESYSIYGGNIASSLSGEYSYSLSLGLSLVFLGLMYRLIVEARGRPILAAGVLTLTVLSHLLPVILIVLVTPILAYLGFRRNGMISTVRPLVIVYGLAFSLTAFWSLPFLVRLPYTTDMRWVPLSGWDPVSPQELRPYLAAQLLGFVVAFLRRDKRLTIFAAMSAVGLLFYFFLPAGSVWNGRFLPFYYLSAFLTSAYLAGFLVSAGSRAFSVRRAGAATLAASLGVAVLTLVWALDYRDATYIDDWIRHNYRGYEAMDEYPTFKALNDRLAQLPEGRVVWEPNDELGKFGTPIALMSIPYWSGQPTIEGINFESSMTTPFHFLMASELSASPSNPIPGLPYRGLDLARGVQHLELFDVRYYLAFTEPAKVAASEAGLTKIEDIGEFALFQIGSTGQVVVPGRDPLPVEFKGSEWVAENIEWFGKPAELDRPMVQVSAKEWEEVASSVAPAAGISIEAVVKDDEISFVTDAVGLPHLVKTSYFPNWKVEGAGGPYLASPSLMIVVPTQREVRLHYSRSWVEWLGLLLTLAAVVGVLLPGFRRILRRRPDESGKSHVD